MRYGEPDAVLRHHPLVGTLTVILYHRLSERTTAGALAGVVPAGRIMAALRHGWVVFGGALVLLAGLWLFTPTLRGTLRAAALATLFASGQTWLALVLFVSIVWLVYRAFRLILLRLHRNNDRVLPLLAVFLLLVLAANAFPIVVYIRAFDARGLSPLAVTVGSLLLANALLYFFFNRFFHTLWRELHRLYAVSAIYKGDTAIGYAQEAMRWEILNILKPLYLYLFSFTLFTDYFLQHRRAGAPGEASGVAMGIIGQLFDTISNEHWTAQVWLALLVLWVFIWPQRALLDWVARRWERRHHVGVG